LKARRELFDTGPVRVIVEDGGENTFVYVGPLMDGTEDEVERLKDLIDGALGRATSSR